MGCLLCLRLFPLYGEHNFLFQLLGRTLSLLHVFFRGGVAFEGLETETQHPLLHGVYTEPIYSDTLPIKL